MRIKLKNVGVISDCDIEFVPGINLIVGSSGSGKSTLMKVFAGLQECDSGERSVQKNTRIVYLPQSGIVHKGTTLLEEVDKAFFYGYELTSEMEKIGDELALTSSLTESRQKQLLERHHEITEYLENSNWHRRDALAEQTLIGLGFSSTDFKNASSILFIIL